MRLLVNQSHNVTIIKVKIVMKFLEESSKYVKSNEYCTELIVLYFLYTQIKKKYITRFSGTIGTKNN